MTVDLERRRDAISHQASVRWRRERAAGKTHYTIEDALLDTLVERVVRLEDKLEKTRKELRAANGR